MTGDSGLGTLAEKLASFCKESSQEGSWFLLKKDLKLFSYLQKCIFSAYEKIYIIFCVDLGCQGFNSLAIATSRDLHRIPKLPRPSGFFTMSVVGFRSSGETEIILGGTAAEAARARVLQSPS